MGAQARRGVRRAWSARRLDERGFLGPRARGVPRPGVLRLHAAGDGAANGPGRLLQPRAAAARLAAAAAPARPHRAAGDLPAVPRPGGLGLLPAPAVLA